LLVLAGSARLALAIGPDYQVTPDTFDNMGNFSGVPAPWGTLNDTVRLLGGTTNGATANLGSGTVIGVQPDPTLAGVDDVAILTANHVAVGGVTLATFGVGINAPAPYGYNAWALTLNVLPVYQTFSLGISANNPQGLPEDMSIVEAQVAPAVLANPGPANPWNAYAASEWNLVAANTINPVLWPSAIPAATPTNVPSMTLPASVPFSISGGYGQGGQYNFNNNTYQATQPSSVRRFMNGTVNSTFGPSVNNVSGYFEPLVGWPGQAPSNAGVGAALPGDSGSGYLVNTNYPVSILVTNFDNISGIMTNNTSGITNYITLNATRDVAAEEWGGTSEMVGNGGMDYGVPLTSNSLVWADTYADSPWLVSVPEPGSFLLVVLGTLTLLQFVRRQIM
jgi:hypothetical protein